MELPHFLASVMMVLGVILKVAAGFIALNKKATLIGLGFLLTGLLNAVTWVFYTFVFERLFDAGHADFADVVIKWINSITGLLHLLGMTLILVGICKLSKQA